MRYEIWDVLDMILQTQAGRGSSGVSKHKHFYAAITHHHRLIRLYERLCDQRWFNNLMMLFSIGCNPHFRLWFVRGVYCIQHIKCQNKLRAWKARIAVWWATRCKETLLQLFKQMARRFQVPETQVRQIVFFGPLWWRSGRWWNLQQKSVILAQRFPFIIVDFLTTSW